MESRIRSTVWGLGHRTGVAVTALATVLVLCVFAAPASAAAEGRGDASRSTAADGTGPALAPRAALGIDTWVNAGTGFCLSSNFSGSVYTTRCSGVEYHRWRFDDGLVASLFVNDGTDLCMSSNSHGSVYTTPCADVRHHRWTWTSDLELVNTGTGLCLSSNFSGRVYTTRCTGVIYHEWR